MTKQQLSDIDSAVSYITNHTSVYDNQLSQVQRLHHCQKIYLYILAVIFIVVAVFTYFDIITNGFTAFSTNMLILLVANFVAMFYLNLDRKHTPEMLKPAIKSIRQMKFNKFDSVNPAVLQNLLIIACGVGKEKEALNLMKDKNDLTQRLYDFLKPDIVKINESVKHDENKWWFNFCTRIYLYKDNVVLMM